MFNVLYLVQCSYCPSGWSYYSNKCYTKVTWKEKYSNAKADCISMGATLAIPNNASEFSFINSTLNSGVSYLVG